MWQNVHKQRTKKSQDNQNIELTTTFRKPTLNWNCDSRQVEVLPRSITPALLPSVWKQLLRERCSLKDTAENSVLLCPWSRPTFPRVAALFVSTSVYGCCFQQSAFYIWHSDQRCWGGLEAVLHHKRQKPSKISSFSAMASITAGFYVFSSPGGFRANLLIWFSFVVWFCS